MCTSCIICCHATQTIFHILQLFLICAQLWTKKKKYN
jgi:hypothetical protein